MSEMEHRPAPLPPPPKTDAVRISLRTATVLLVFTLVFTALMAGVYQLTKPVLETAALDAKRRLVATVLPPGDYDNDLMNDALELPAVPALGLTEPSWLYRARKGGKPVALVFEAAASDGYAGHIGLLLAVRADGRLAAVRVTQHRETPGLGDYIDPKRDKNKEQPWISQFSGRSFADTPREKWRVKKDGGVFDQRTGATISARAVTKATGLGLAWALDRADVLFVLPSGHRYEEK